MSPGDATTPFLRMLALIDTRKLEAARPIRDMLRGVLITLQVLTASEHLRYDESVPETSSAIGYARVSTSEQARTGYGLEAQKRAIRSEVKYREWQLVDLILDEGESGKDLNRAGVRDLLDRLANGEADALVVHKLDRLTRSVLDLATLLEWSVRVGVRLVIQDLGIDTGTANGRLVVTIMAGVAEWERDQISARTLDAAAERRGAGKKMGREGVRDTNPELAQRIRADRDAGATWQSIADSLNTGGVPTVRGGALWRVSAVQSAAGYIRPTAQARRVTLPEPKRARHATPTGPRNAHGRA